MFGAENRQWDGKAQVCEGYDPVEAASPNDIVFSDQQTNYEQRKAAADIQKAVENSKNAARIGGCMDLLNQDDVVLAPNLF